MIEHRQTPQNSYKHTKKRIVEICLEKLTKPPNYSGYHLHAGYSGMGEPKGFTKERLSIRKKWKVAGNHCSLFIHSHAEKLLKAFRIIFYRKRHISNMLDLV